LWASTIQRPPSTADQDLRAQFQNQAAMRSIDRVPFLPLAHRCDVEADCPYLSLKKKNEPRCGIDTHSRGSGHGYYLLLRKVFS